MERIRGGWGNVPPHLKTKTMLSQEGLKPSADPVAEVWGGRQWIRLYDATNTLAKRKASEKQLVTLRKARELAREKYRAEHTCSVCREVYKSSDLRDQSDGTKTCIVCIERLSWEARYDSMVFEGRERFKTWYNRDFIILDTESTGVEGEIVEIGIVDRAGSTLFHSLVKPVEPVPDDSDATLIHGITNSQLAEAPKWSEIWNDVQAILAGKLVLAYNARFDESMVMNSCQRNGLIYPGQFTWDCVMEAYRLTQGSERWFSLQKASGCQTSHRALEDCLSALRVIHSQWVEMGISAEATA